MTTNFVCFKKDTEARLAGTVLEVRADFNATCKPTPSCGPSHHLGATALSFGSLMGINNFSHKVGSVGPMPTSSTLLSAKVPKMRSQIIAAQP